MNQWQSVEHYLSNRHGAQDIKEDERAVSVIFTQKIAVGKALDVRQGNKWQLRYNSPIKAEVKGGKKQENLMSKSTSLNIRDLNKSKY